MTEVIGTGRVQTRQRLTARCRVGEDFAERGRVSKRTKQTPGLAACRSAKVSVPVAGSGPCVRHVPYSHHYVVSLHQQHHCEPLANRARS